METNPQASSNLSADLLRELAELRRWQGAPRDFWPRYVAVMGQLSGASRSVVLVRAAQEDAPWKKISEWSSGRGKGGVAGSFVQQLENLAKGCVDSGPVLAALDGKAGGSRQPMMMGMPLNLLSAQEKCVLAFLLLDSDENAARDSLFRLNLITDVPEAFQLNQAVRKANQDVEKMAGAVDLLVQVNNGKKFLSAALAFCNGLATRYRCDRVSLGWLEKGYLRLRAISRVEKFDRHMVAAKELEVAMEEAFDQDEEICWPALEGTQLVTRDHEIFVKEQKVGNICSLPLREDLNPMAVLSCERAEDPFSEAELQQIRLATDLATTRLADLKRRSRWFGARWATFLKEKIAVLLGPEHTWAKVIALIVAVALAILFFGRFNYRVEANFILKSEQVSFLTSPFDGYIEQVLVRPGDAVKENDLLLVLNTDDLVLQEASAEADYRRYLREAEKARAERQLAAMRIAEALADQAQARLDLVRYRLQQSNLASPFDGVVVEGDLRDRVGSPVEQGESLFKVARTDDLFLEAEVDERDIHEILHRDQGEIAFVSQPKFKYPVTIERTEPAAFPKEAGNVFRVRCLFQEESEDWWRPGMSGVCKLQVEKRSLFWIITHRTVDFLRMKLWW